MHFLFQLKGMQEVTKEVAHGKKITQMQINLVKLPYSAQKVLPYEYVYMHKKSTTQKVRLLIQSQPSVSFRYSTKYKSSTYSFCTLGKRSRAKEGRREPTWEAKPATPQKCILVLRCC